MTTQTNRPIDQQDLPEPRQVEVLEALQAEPATPSSWSTPWIAERTRRSGCRTRPRRARRAARRRACPGARGSRPAIIGARKMPAARNEVATQNSASCTCQVRARLYGKHLGQVEAEEASDLGAVVLRRRRRPASGAGTAPPSTKKNQARRALRRASAPRRRARGTTSVGLLARRASRASRSSARRRRTACRCRRAARSATARVQTITFGGRLVVDPRLGGQLLV